jgi:farnesyl diphosphate synthase
VHKQYDEATAILAGDALLTFAFEILADPATHPDPQMRCLLIAGLARAAGPQGMVAGQMIDIAGETAEGDIAGVARMNRLKTGCLFSFAVEAGALIGAAPENARHALARYANDVGVAFQMVDDLLDVTGEEGEMGKAVAKDKTAGKVNFVSLLGVEGAVQRVQLLSAQAKRHLTIFGERGRTLCDAVDFILERRY